MEVTVDEDNGTTNFYVCCMHDASLVLSVQEPF